MNKPRKVIDIIPPGSVRGFSQKPIQHFSSLKRLKQPSFGGPASSRSIFTLSFKKKLFLLGGVFVVIAIFGYFRLPRAEIKIWPVTESLRLNVQVVADKTINQIDFAKNLIPAIYLENEKKVLREFSSTGRNLKEIKAEGTIRLFNEFSTAPFALIPRTRFISADKKEFLTPRRVVIPGKRREAGRIIPGTIDIKVIADQPGEEFNIGPSNFSIPGLAGTAMFFTIYGESFEPMSGGFRGEVVKITQNDLDEAERTLRKEVLGNSLEGLKGELLAGFVLPEKTIEQEVVEIFSPVKAGHELELFLLRVKARTKGLSFNELDLENFAKKYMLSYLEQEINNGNKKLYQESLKIYWSITNVDLKAGRMTIDLNFSGKIYQAINESLLKPKIKEKNISQANQILEKQPQIRKVETELWPFWAKKIPKIAERIEFHLIFHSLANQSKSID